jgi:hypothetical protein
VKDSAGGCGAAAGGDDYRHAIDGSSPLCDLSVNQVVDVKTGQNTGPTKQGIDTRVTSWQPITSIVQFTSGGNAIVLQPNSPQLVILPIVENLSGGSQWPGGAGQVRIRGFGYFVLNQPGYSDGGKTVLGTFVGLQNTDTHWITGAYDPANNTAHTVQLTG